MVETDTHSHRLCHPHGPVGTQDTRAGNSYRDLSSSRGSQAGRHRDEELPLRDDENLSNGDARVEAGRLLVQGSIDEAFEQIRNAILELKVNRQAAVAASIRGGTDASEQ